MGATVTTAATKETTWGGGNEPFKVSYGKMMMWYFILSDSLTFCGFLVGYGFTRYKFMDSWPIADEVFNHFPFLHGVDAPMYYVALMTFILIFSSVTMVLAVDAGHQMKRNKVATYMFMTIIGGLVFLGSQAWEWKNFIQGTYGAVETRGGAILQFVGADNKQIALSDFAIIDKNRDETTMQRNDGLWFMNGPKVPTYSMEEITKGFLANPDLKIRTQFTIEDQETGHREKEVLTREESISRLQDAVIVVEGANLIRNEYGHRTFGDFFFFITGFHGFHVFTGILINTIIFFNVLIGTYDRRGSYEMVEKGGLYWHFVDLVWVFVFTFFYLV